MERKDVIKKLKEFQEWRLGADTPMLPVGEITEVIDEAIRLLSEPSKRKLLNGTTLLVNDLSNPMG